MRVAFSTMDDLGVNARISQHFGRCPFFTVVEVDEEGEVVNIETHENPYYNAHVQGAVPKFVSSLGVDAIIAGGMGPRAIMFFESAGIKPFTTDLPTVSEALFALLRGEMEGASPCKDSHHGGDHHHEQ